MYKIELRFLMIVHFIEMRRYSKLYIYIKNVKRFTVTVSDDVMNKLILFIYSIKLSLFCRLEFRI